jgi:hypothetical protein
MGGKDPIGLLTQPIEIAKAAIEETVVRGLPELDLVKQLLDGLSENLLQVSLAELGELD